MEEFLKERQFNEGDDRKDRDRDGAEEPAVAEYPQFKDGVLETA